MFLPCLVDLHLAAIFILLMVLPNPDPDPPKRPKQLKFSRDSDGRVVFLPKSSTNRSVSPTPRPSTSSSTTPRSRIKRPVASATITRPVDPTTQGSPPTTSNAIINLESSDDEIYPATPPPPSRRATVASSSIASSSTSSEATTSSRKRNSAGTTVMNKKGVLGVRVTLGDIGGDDVAAAGPKVSCPIPDCRYEGTLESFSSHNQKVHSNPNSGYNLLERFTCMTRQASDKDSQEMTASQEKERMDDFISETRDLDCTCNENKPYTVYLAIGFKTENPPSDEDCANWLDEHQDDEDLDIIWYVGKAQGIWETIPDHHFTNRTTLYNAMEAGNSIYLVHLEHYSSVDNQRNRNMAEAHESYFQLIGMAHESYRGNDDGPDRHIGGPAFKILNETFESKQVERLIVEGVYFTHDNVGQALYQAHRKNSRLICLWKNCPFVHNRHSTFRHTIPFHPTYYRRQNKPLKALRPLVTEKKSSAQARRDNNPLMKITRPTEAITFKDYVIGPNTDGKYECGKEGCDDCQNKGKSTVWDHARKYHGSLPQYIEFLDKKNTNVAKTNAKQIGFGILFPCPDEACGESFPTNVSMRMHVHDVHRNPNSSYNMKKKMKAQKKVGSEVDSQNQTASQEKKDLDDFLQTNSNVFDYGGTRNRIYSVYFCIGITVDDPPEDSFVRQYLIEHPDLLIETYIGIFLGRITKKIPVYHNDDTYTTSTIYRAMQRGATIYLVHVDVFDTGDYMERQDRARALECYYQMVGMAQESYRGQEDYKHFEGNDFSILNKQFECSNAAYLIQEGKFLTQSDLKEARYQAHKRNRGLICLQDEHHVHNRFGNLRFTFPLHPTYFYKQDPVALTVSVNSN